MGIGLIGRKPRSFFEKASKDFPITPEFAHTTRSQQYKRKYGQTRPLAMRRVVGKIERPNFVNVTTYTHERFYF